MAKWMISVSVAAMVVLGLLLWSSKSSVEYHIRQYRKAERKLTAQETVLDEIRDTLRKIRSKGIGRIGRLRNEMLEHKAELIRLGYLEERTFTVTNRLPTEFAAATQKALMKRGTNYEFFSAATYPNTNIVRVIAVKGMMPSEEEVLREMRQASRVNGN